MCINLSSAYDVRAENAGHVNLCLCLSFQTRISVMKNGVMRMMSVMGTYSVFCSKTSSRLKRGARFEVGGGGGGGGGGAGAAEEGGTPLFGLYGSGMCC